MMEQKFIILERGKNIYHKKLYDNELLSSIVEIFLDGCSLWEYIRTRLHTPGSRGVTGNGVEVIFEGTQVIIGPIWFEGLQDPEEYAVAIDRDVLLRLIDRWEEVIKDRPEFITFTIEDDGEISVVGS